MYGGGGGSPECLDVRGGITSVFRCTGGRGGGSPECLDVRGGGGGVT